MWIFAKEGFVSIVADEADPNNLLVRGRIKGDIEALFPKARVKVTPFRDYRFRASVDRVEAAVKIAEHVGSIKYTNYKDSTPKARHCFLLRIWSIMMDEQDRRLTHRQRNEVYNKRYGAFRRTAAKTDPLSGYPLLPGDVLDGYRPDGTRYGDEYPPTPIRLGELDDELPPWKDTTEYA